MAFREEEIYDVLRHQYNIEVEATKPFDSLYRAQVAWRVHSNAGVYKLKLYPFGRLNLEHLFLRYQSAQPRVSGHLPKWHETISGHPYIQMGDGLYYLTDWVEGRPYAHQPDDAYQLGKTLAQIHQPMPKLEGFDSISMAQRLRPFTKANEILNRKSYTYTPSFVRRFLRQTTPEIQFLIDKSVAKLNRVKGKLQPVLSHGDVTVPNVLYQGSAARLIDWERLNRRYASEELAIAVMNTCNLSDQLSERLLDGYRFKSMPKPEKEAFIAFLMLPREVAYLVQRLHLRTMSDSDKALWQLVIQTWRDRMKLVEFARTL